MELKGRLSRVLRTYFERHSIEADWSAVEAAPLAGLVTAALEPDSQNSYVAARLIARALQCWALYALSVVALIVAWWMPRVGV